MTDLDLKAQHDASMAQLAQVRQSKAGLVLAEQRLLGRIDLLEEQLATAANTGDGDDEPPAGAPVPAPTPEPDPAAGGAVEPVALTGEEAPGR